MSKRKDSVAAGQVTLERLEARVLLSGDSALAGDFNGDSMVDDSDLSLLLTDWAQAAGQEPAGGAGSAIDGALSLLLANWGAGPAEAPAGAAAAEPASVVGEPVINGGDAQRSTISSLSLAFDSDVSAALDVADLALHNDNTDTPVDLSGLTQSDFTYDSAGNVATWDLSGVELANGFHTGTIAADGAGVAEDYTFEFHRLLCDVNGDTRVNAVDLDVWEHAYDPLGENDNGPGNGDWNGDGLIDSRDMGLWQQNHLPDGLIVPQELIAVASGPYAITTGWELQLNASGSRGAIAFYEWDLNNDGIFDLRANSLMPKVQWSSVLSLICESECILDHPYPITLRVTDVLGRTATDATTVTITDREVSQAHIHGVGTFAFDPDEVQRVREDILQEGSFSLFAILAHLDDRGVIDMASHFEPEMNAHVIDTINSLPNWWYQAYYDGGWPENNVYRIDHYPYKERLTFHVFQTQDLARRDSVFRIWREELDRIELNGGKVIIPEVTLRGPTETWTFENVEVTPHGLRDDVFQLDVITAVDVIMSLGDQGKITYGLRWWDSIGTAEIVRTYYVDRINDAQSFGTCGFVYEAGDHEFDFFRGNHIHIPSDFRPINSPQYVEFFWICL